MLTAGCNSSKRLSTAVSTSILSTTGFSSCGTLASAPIHSQPALAARSPEGIETLFYTVEAYCPDPALRDPTLRNTGSPFEADEAEVRKDAELALARLKDSRQ